MRPFTTRHLAALAFTTAVVPTALAQTNEDSAVATQQVEAAVPLAQDQLSSGAIETAPAVPPAGPQLGQHVSGMAPEHPKSHGEMFGDCVSEMAVTGECSHHQ